jgi:hypothetical protein
VKDESTVTSGSLDAAKRNRSYSERSAAIEVIVTDTSSRFPTTSPKAAEARDHGIAIENFGPAGEPSSSKRSDSSASTEPGLAPKPVD